MEKGKEGTVTLTRTPEQVEELVDSQQWKQLFGEEEAKRRSTGSSQETEEKMQVIQAYPKGETEQSRCECHYHRPEAGI